MPWDHSPDAHGALTTNPASNVTPVTASTNASETDATILASERAVIARDYRRTAPERRVRRRTRQWVRLLRTEPAGLSGTSARRPGRRPPRRRRGRPQRHG